MFLTKLKFTFRMLLRSKMASAINITGFAFSLSICFIIAIYLSNEFSYDKFHKNYNNIYRVVNDEDQRSQVDYTIKDILNEIPEVEQSCHVLIRDQKMPVSFNGNTIYINRYALTDNDFFRIFSFPLIVGNPKEPFDKDKRSVLVSERVSATLFGKENSTGKIVKLFNRDDYIIGGVFKDFPENSSIYADIIQNENYEINPHSERYSKNGKIEYQRTVFLTLNTPGKAEQVTATINQHLTREKKAINRVWLQPMKEIYMFDETRNWGFNKGNFKLIKLFSGIGILILILSSINYLNISVARFHQCTKETGVKKILGAGKISMVKSFVSESILIMFISLFLSVILTFLFLPLFNSSFNLQLHIPDLSFISFFMFLSVIGSILGILNGIWPALIINSFNPLYLFKHKIFQVKGKNNIRTLLTVMQFTASIILIICVLSILKQLNFIKHKDLGFNDSYLVKIKVSFTNKYDPLKVKLLQNPSIKNAAYSFGIPGEIQMGQSAGLDAGFYKEGLPTIGAEAAFLNTLQLDLLQGREFMDNENGQTCLLSETALKELGWEKDWPEKFFMRDENHTGYRIVGVFKDLHFQSMYRKIRPLAIINDINFRDYLTVRISGQNISETINYMRNTWNEIEPGVPFDFSFYDDWYDSMYEKEEQLATMIIVFAILAVIISCMGIFAQSLLNSTGKIKEIGVRKVNGAKVVEIMTMLNKDFLGWGAISFILACPIAWYAMNKWLQSFAYKTQLSWWIFTLAGVLALGIMLLTVSFQSYKAAIRNPVESLRYE